MAVVECPSSLQQHVWQQVQLLHSTQTAPYEVIVADYAGCLQRKRDLEVTPLLWYRLAVAVQLLQVHTLAGLAVHRSCMRKTLPIKHHAKSWTTTQHT
jgi:hypothetical protein